MKKRVALAVALGIAAAVFFFYQLGDFPFEDYDEATYADVARRVTRGEGGDPFTLYRFGSWFDKPPLVIWLMAAGFRVFRDPELAARLPSAVFGFLTVIVVAAIAFELTKRRVAAALAAAALIVAEPFVTFSREGRLDAPAAFFIMLAWLFWLRAWRAPERPRAMIGFFAAVGGGIMAKSALGLIPLGLAVAVGLASDARRTLRILVSRESAVGLAVCAFIVVPWHVSMTIRHGAAFWDDYLGTHIINRLRGINVIGGAARGAAFYALELARRAPAWSIAALAASVLLLRSAGGRASFRWVAAPGLALFIFFSLVTTKLAAYILPTLPFFAVTVGAALASIGRRIAIPVAAAFFIFAGSEAARGAFHLVPTPHDRALADERAVGALLTGTEKPIYLYYWQAAESLVFYSGRPVRFLPRTTSLIIPEAEFFLVAPSVVANNLGMPGRALRYAGEALTLFEQ